jgi:hypothetical protein
MVLWISTPARRHNPEKTRFDADFSADFPDFR